MSGPVGTRQILRDSARIAEVVAAAPTAAVPSCPGWTVRDLVVHLGGVHRWVVECVESGAPRSRTWETDPLPAAPTDEGAELAAWLNDGAVALTDVLDARDPAAPTWTPFPIEHPTVSVWTRRQTQETSLHRVDAECAVGEATPIDATLAADGIDEYLGLLLPRMVARDGLVLPAGSAHLHCTDTEGEWTVEVTDGQYLLDRSHRKGDAAVRGTAEHLLLLLWGRQVPDGAIEVIGDQAIAAAWTGIGGT